MIWHIFKKDWKLTWMFVLVVVVVRWMYSAVIYKLGLFGEDPTLGMLAQVFPILADFASMFLIAAIVHLDAIPGMRHDWLVRPVSRLDLVIEKFLFVVLMVDGPVLLAVLFQGLANKFSFRMSLVAALWQVTFLLFALILPIFSFASATENMTQAFIFGCGCTFLISAFLTIASDLNGRAHGTLEPVPYSSVGWVGETMRFALILVAAGTILGLQYFRRKTLTSRALVLAFGFAILATVFLPWRPAFAIEKALSPNPSVGANAVMVLNPQGPKFHSPSGLAGSARHDYSTSIFLPLKVTGLQTDTFLISDRVQVRLLDTHQKNVFEGVGEGLQVAKEGPDPVEEPVYQEIPLHSSLYHALSGESLRAEITYSLTSFAMKSSYSMPALGGDERMPGFGWCQTKMNEVETVVELRCMWPGKGPTCAMLFLENETTGRRNPTRSACHGEYSPYSGWYTGDNMAHFGANIPFRDPSGLAKFPVDGPQLPQSRLVIRVYEPEDHFTRSITIPQIRLQDWQAQ